MSFEEPSPAPLAQISAWMAEARQEPAAGFAASCFERLRSLVRSDRGAVITSRADTPSYHDAHYFGFPDIADTMASWATVAHLDDVSPKVLSTPGRAQRQDVDMPQIAGKNHEPLREHLQRHGIVHTLAIAVRSDDAPFITVFLLIRQTLDDRFSDAELARLEQWAPLVHELLSVNRGQALLRSRVLDARSVPLAMLSRGGALVLSTPAFAELMWPGAQAPQTPFLGPECMAALSAGKPWPLPDGRNCLHALPDSEGWLLRVAPTSRLDQLSLREREIAQLYANGSTHKVISRRLGLAPSTAPL
jgi:hypothetical protein